MSSKVIFNNAHFKCRILPTLKWVDGAVTDLKVDVDKRMPIEVFKKHLEQYVHVPSPYFKLLCTPKCDMNSSTNNLYVTSLMTVSNDATIRVHLRRLTKPGVPKTNLFYLDLGSSKVCSFKLLSIHNKVITINSDITTKFSVLKNL